MVGAGSVGVVGSCHFFGPLIAFSKAYLMEHSQEWMVNSSKEKVLPTLKTLWSLEIIMLLIKCKSSLNGILNRVILVHEDLFAQARYFVNIYRIKTSAIQRTLPIKDENIQQQLLLPLFLVYLICSDICKSEYSKSFTYLLCP